MDRRVPILLAFLFCSSIGHAEEVVEIPLSEVWGINFLETKQASHLEREPKNKDGNRRLSYEERSQRLNNSMTYQIHRALEDMPRTEMLRGFAVHGEGREALEYVHDILVKRRPIEHSFQQGSVLSAVFFTRTLGYLHLTEIKRARNTFTIKYCYAPLSSREIVSPKLALIPLGALPSGDYQVNILGYSKKPDDSQSNCEPIKDLRMETLICKPFKFTVKKPNNARRNSVRTNKRFLNNPSSSPSNATPASGRSAIAKPTTAQALRD